METAFLPLWCTTTDMCVRNSYFHRAKLDRKVRFFIRHWGNFTSLVPFIAWIAAAGEKIRIQWSDIRQRKTISPDQKPWLSHLSCRAWRNKPFLIAPCDEPVLWQWNWRTILEEIREQAITKCIESDPQLVQISIDELSLIIDLHQLRNWPHGACLHLLRDPRAAIDALAVDLVGLVKTR